MKHKGWELIKHLEEGGNLRGRASGSTYLLRHGNLVISCEDGREAATSFTVRDVITAPNKFEAVVPKIKRIREVYVKFDAPLPKSGIGDFYRIFEVGGVLQDADSTGWKKCRITIEEL